MITKNVPINSLKEIAQFSRVADVIFYRKKFQLQLSKRGVFYKCLKGNWRFFKGLFLDSKWVIDAFFQCELGELAHGDRTQLASQSREAASKGKRD